MYLNHRDYSTYRVYGVHIPKTQYTETFVWEEAKRLYPILRNSIIGTLCAGEYDNEELFLIVTPKDKDVKIELGSFRIVTPASHAADLPFWDEELREACRRAGYTEYEGPGWLIVPDLS